MENEQNGWKNQWIPIAIGFMIPVMLAGGWFLYRKINGIVTTAVDTDHGINYPILTVVILCLCRAAYNQRKKQKRIL